MLAYYPVYVAGLATHFIFPVFAIAITPFLIDIVPLLVAMRALLLIFLLRQLKLAQLALIGYSD